jgi:hypothetical protein
MWIKRNHHGGRLNMTVVLREKCKLLKGKFYINKCKHGYQTKHILIQDFVNHETL